MRKPRALGRIGQHCLSFVDKISAAETEECIGQYHSACGSPDVPLGQSQALPGPVQSPCSLATQRVVRGSTEDIPRELREV